MRRQDIAGILEEALKAIRTEKGHDVCGPRCGCPGWLRGAEKHLRAAIMSSHLVYASRKKALSLKDSAVQWAAFLRLPGTFYLETQEDRDAIAVCLDALRLSGDVE
jgi:hypothetical protein